VNSGLFAVTLVRNCEFLATLGAAGGEHAAAIGCQHTFTKTVLVLSLAIVGLKCSFHFRIFSCFVAKDALTGCKSRDFFSFTQVFGDFLRFLLHFLLNFHYLCTRKTTNIAFIHPL